MIKQSTTLLFLSSVFLLNAQTIDISGTVKNQAKVAVVKMEVALKSLGIKAATDSSGKFSIKQTGFVSFHEQRQQVAPRIKGNQFVIPVIAGSQKVSIDIFDLKGSKVATVINKVLPQGEHTVPIMSSNNSPLSASILVAVVRRGTDMARFQIAKMGNGSFLIREFSSGASDCSAIQQTAALPALDSLLFIRRLKIEGQDKVLNEFAIPITKWTDKFEVIVDLIPYEAIEWGKTQEGRSDEDVGKELKTQNIYPYELYRYSKGTAWCSEFYSYCMRIGGCPLGDDAGTATSPHWLVNGWNLLITWFQNNAKYVEKSQITAQNYVPNPGDFIQLNEHTAMVRYLQGTTLYCLDGNYGDKVVLVNRGNYATFSGLNGYGRRSGITGNSYKSISIK